MKSRLLTNHPQRTYVVVLAAGEDAVVMLQRFADAEGLSSASVQGIGAFARCALGFFDRTRRDYERIEINEQVEVLTLLGNVTRHEERPKLHLHVVVGKRAGSAHGGHLLEAEVWPTLEIIVTENPPHLRRSVDAEIGLPLLDPELRGE
jgi:uncharacterized protein